MIKNLEQKVEKLNSKKLLKYLEQNYREKFTFYSYLYYTKLNDLNIAESVKDVDFYYKALELFSTLDNAIKTFDKILKNNLKINKDTWKRDFMQITTMKNENVVKLKNHLEKENILIKTYIKKAQTFARVLDSSIQFVQKQMVELNLVYIVDTNFTCIATFLKSVKDLKQYIKKSNIKVGEELEFLFKSFKYLPENDHAFVILTTKQLKSLKSINKMLNNPVNFPVWERKKSKDINFKDGKGFGIFEEFTETY